MISNRSGRTEGGNGLPADVDSKLLHLVRRIWSDQDFCLDDFQWELSVAASHGVVPLLRERHREYKRKDLAQLNVDVESALRQITDKNKAKTKASAKGTTNIEESEEAEYDRAAAIRDSLEAGTDHHTNSFGGGGLNASLLTCYRQIATTTRIAMPAATTQSDDPHSMPKTNAPSLTTDPMPKANPSNATSATIGINVSRTDTPRAKIVHEGSSSVATAKSTKRRKLRRSEVQQSRGDGNKDFDMMDSNNASASFLLPVSKRPTERYADLGGMGSIVQTIRQLVEYPVTRPELYRHLGVDPPRGVLLRGPPGTGKTHLANAVAGQLGVPFFRVSAPELVSGVSGDSESRIRNLFQAASDVAPSIIFLDEIDAIAPKRSGGGDGGGSRGMEKRMVAQLLTSMDNVAPRNNRNQNAVIVLAATNRPDSIDPALRRAGRFDKEILLGVPDEDARERILRAMTKDMRLLENCNDGDDNNTNGEPSSPNTAEATPDSRDCRYFDFKLLARKTPGFVGADVKSLAKEAAVVAINRIFRDVLKDDTMNEFVPTKANDVDGNVGNSCSQSIVPLSNETLKPLYVTMEDFLAAIPLVQPSSQREGFATVPDVSWDDIGALQSIRDELTLSVLEPIRAPEKFKALGLQLPAGVMLYGPPGCGKTLLAKAIAHESGANFISVKGPELLDKYVGESERAVRVLFERARCSSPCIIFFDELDSLVPRRGSDHGSGGGSGVSERVVNQLLTEMDGLESRRSVFVIAATNRPELIDPAMLRPGRLDKLLYVPLPTPAERVSILRALASNVTLSDDVNLEEIGSSHRAEGFSGADCAALLREAGLAVLKEDMATVQGAQRVELCVMQKHFNAAFHSVLPSVSKKDQARYDKIRDRMARARSRGENEDKSPADDEISPDVNKGS